VLKRKSGVGVLSCLASISETLRFTQLNPTLTVGEIGIANPSPCKLLSKDNCDKVVSNSTKTGELRSVPLFKEVAAILQRRKAANKRHIFDYSYSSVYKDFKKAVKLARIDPNITLHTLRKTFGSRLVNKVPITKISKWLGHSSVVVTEQWYVILVNNDHSDWLEKLEGKKEDVLIDNYS